MVAKALVFEKINNSKCSSGLQGRCQFNLQLLSFFRKSKKKVIGSAGVCMISALSSRCWMRQFLKKLISKLEFEPSVPGRARICNAFRRTTQTEAE